MPGVVTPPQWRNVTGQGPYDRKKLTEWFASVPVLIAAVIFLAWLLSLMGRFYRHLHDALQPWHAHVLIYLCMEKASIWRELFGFSHASSEDFEHAFGQWWRARQSSVQRVDSMG